MRVPQSQSCGITESLFFCLWGRERQSFDSGVGGGGGGRGARRRHCNDVFLHHVYCAQKSNGGGGVRGRGVNGGHAHPAPIVQLCFNVHIQSKLL